MSAPAEFLPRRVASAVPCHSHSLSPLRASRAITLPWDLQHTWLGLPETATS